MYCLKHSQCLPLNLDECWDFFSNPENLQTLTPDYLRFQITNDLEKRPMYPGQIIGYTLHPFWNIPVSWVTEITHVEKPFYFIDEQRFGPYKFWHHEHRFKAISNGVEMVDTVYYKMPLGFFGKTLHALKVKKDLERIFSFRRKKLEALYGPYTETY